MSLFAILVAVGFAAVSLWGVYMGVSGCLADAPPFMQGEGKSGRFDSRMHRAA